MSIGCGPGDIHGGVDSARRSPGDDAQDDSASIWTRRSRLRPQRIKVLTLFFMDKVAHYRRYDDEGNPVKGEYARIFEEEYRRAANRPEYRALFEGLDVQEAAESAHEGYFSIDRRGGWTRATAYKIRPINTLSRKPSFNAGRR